MDLLSLAPEENYVLVHDLYELRLFGSNLFLEQCRVPILPETQRRHVFEWTEGSGSLSFLPCPFGVVGKLGAIDAVAISSVGARPAVLLHNAIIPIVLSTS
jgi:hypothetical protein